MEKPKRGDVVVFKLPSDPRINYVKRLIGLPGDKIQMRQGRLYVNGEEIEKNSEGFFEDSEGAIITKIPQFVEKISDEKTVKVLDQVPDAPQDNTGVYEVPIGYYFMMGDNRDNSQDSRFLSEVGYVPQENLVGRATIIFCSTANFRTCFSKIG
jgi:signal peptidase I